MTNETQYPTIEELKKQIALLIDSSRNGFWGRTAAKYKFENECLKAHVRALELRLKTYADERGVPDGRETSQLLRFL